MKCKAIAASLILLGYAFAANAQESAAETQSIRCGAIAHILTVIKTPPTFNEAMAQSGMFYGGVFAAHREARTGAAGTNGEISGRKDSIQAELKKTWPVRPEAVIREAALCNTWRAEYGPRIAAIAGEVRSAAQLIELVGVPPTQPRAGEADKWRPIVTTGFVAWMEAGAQTGGEAKAALRKELEDSIGRKSR